MTYKPYSVVLVPFPFTDSNKTKKRPAIVISTEHFQQETGHVSLLMVTTAKHSHWYGDHLITDLTAAGLPIPSIIRQKLFTIDSRLIIKSIGVLGKPDQKSMTALFHQHVDLHPAR